MLRGLNSCKLLLPILVIDVFLLTHVAAGTYSNDRSCPSSRSQLEAQGWTRKCLKRCRTKNDCHGKNRKCLCDFECGFSCVKESQNCHTLKAVLHGRHKLVTINKFGATVRYQCNPGYILNGQSERVCQGDGYWSGQAPTCRQASTITTTTMTSPSTPTTTPTTTSTTTTPTTTTRQRPPAPGSCSNPPVVPHATHDGVKNKKTFIIGTQLTYTCELGYEVDGFFRAMCIGEGNWVTPRMTCNPVRCGVPPDIDHGHRLGNQFTYPEKVYYNCSEGYTMMGKPFRECLYNQSWSNNVPFCEVIRCHRPTAPIHGTYYGNDVTYNAVVRFSCFTGYQLIGSSTRLCRQDGTWSGHHPRCRLVDCGLPGPFYDGFLDNNQSTYGAIITFNCYGRRTFEGVSRETRCLETGQWSHPVPVCWRQCRVPEIANGTYADGPQPGDYVNHLSRASVTCRAGSKLEDANFLTCYNGTFTTLPRCGPADCSERPQDVSNARLRYYTMRHGDRAMYKCNPGFKLRGDTYLTCQYGIWQGATASCHHIYCSYPGPISFGDVLIVGQIGKYNYRKYVTEVVHNDQIEFQCHKGYNRVGPKGATCVNGAWSPQQKPQCTPKKHPNLSMTQIFRGRRSADQSEGTSVLPKGLCLVPELTNGGYVTHGVGDFMLHGQQLSVWCENGYQPPVRNPLCDDGVWKDAPVCKSSSCVIPTYENARTYDLKHEALLRAQPVRTGQGFLLICDENMVRVGPKRVICTSNGWSEHSRCLPHEDNPTVTQTASTNLPWTLDVKFTNNMSNLRKGFCVIPDVENGWAVDFVVDNIVSDGTRIRIACDSGYVLDQIQPLCDDGVWTPVPICMKDSEVPQATDENHRDVVLFSPQ